MHPCRVRRADSGSRLGVGGFEMARGSSRSRGGSGNTTGKKNIQVTRETETGRNAQFRDPTTGRRMSRAEFVERIERGTYTGYHVRVINGVKTPASNPDRSEGNNLD
jgi:hypothetical protein